MWNTVVYIKFRYPSINTILAKYLNKYRATSGVLSEIHKISKDFADRLDESCRTQWLSFTCAQRLGKSTTDTYNTQNIIVSSYFRGECLAEGLLYIVEIQFCTRDVLLFCYCRVRNTGARCYAAVRYLCEASVIGCFFKVLSACSRVLDVRLPAAYVPLVSGDLHRNQY